MTTSIPTAAKVPEVNTPSALKKVNPSSFAAGEARKKSGAPSDLKSAQALELVALAKQIDAFRARRRNHPSDRSWCHQWPALGSARTWALIYKGKTDTVECAKWLAPYRGVLEALKSDLQDQGQEELYDDITPAQCASLAVLKLMHTAGKERLIFILGPSGSGKTSCLDVLSQSEVSRSMLKFEASETWRGPRDFLHALLTSLGQDTVNKPIPYGTNDRLEKAVKLLNQRGRVLIGIDEAHHCNGPILNTIKTLINRTEVRIVIAAMDTLFRKLRASASEEAKQLYHNRTFAIIRLGQPTPEDTRVFFERRLNIVGGSSWKENSIRKICETSLNVGLWAFMRKVVTDLRFDGYEPDQIDDAVLLRTAHDAASNILA